MLRGGGLKCRRSMEHFFGPLLYIISYHIISIVYSSVGLQLAWAQILQVHASAVQLILKVCVVQLFQG